MHETPGNDLDDDELLTQVREGDGLAYATLFERHRAPARRLARYLSPMHDADDIVSETFTRMLDQIRRGGGPVHAFRAYLMTSIRHEASRRARHRKRVTPMDDVGRMDCSVPFGGGEIDGFERAVVRASFQSLPNRWRAVLWYLDVEGRKPREIAPVLGLTPNSVSALAYRARAGLREAYLKHHLAPDRPDRPDECRGVRRELAVMLRRTPSTRERAKSETHLGQCEPCSSVYAELKDVDDTIASAPGAPLKMPITAIFGSPAPFYPA